MADVFEGVAAPVATADTPGAWLRSWRLLAIDGFDVDLPDSEANAVEFGYAGSGDNPSAYPKARVVALAECGTHAFLAARIGGYAVGEKTLAMSLYPRLRPDELLTADCNFYAFDAWSVAVRSGAALLWRAPTQLRLPVVWVLPDGTYTSVLIDPTIRGVRRARIIAAARAGAQLDPARAHLVRLVEYDVPDRDGNGTGELIALLTTITDPGDARADELAGAYVLCDGVNVQTLGDHRHRRLWPMASEVVGDLSDIRVRRKAGRAGELLKELPVLKAVEQLRHSTVGLVITIWIIYQSTDKRVESSGKPFPWNTQDAPPNLAYQPVRNAGKLKKFGK